MNKRIIDCGGGMKNCLRLAIPPPIRSLSIAYCLFALVFVVYLLRYNEAYEQCSGCILTLIYAVALKGLSVAACVCVCLCMCVCVCGCHKS